MEVNVVAVMACAVLSMIIGGVWYGPLFGRQWMAVIERGMSDEAKREAMRHSPLPLYGVQFILSLVQLFILAQFISTGWNDASGMQSAFLVWLGFVMPTVAGLSLWNMLPMRARLMMFCISAGYQLVSLLAFGWILEMWQ